MGSSDRAVQPEVVDRATWQAAIDGLRVREKAHTREGDAIAAARRRLPMVEVDAGTTLVGPTGPTTLLDVFEGRRQLIAYYFMWHEGRPAAEQCWEDSPAGWPQRWDVEPETQRTNGRPTAQWSRLEAGRSDDLATGDASGRTHNCCS